MNVEVQVWRIYSQEFECGRIVDDDCKFNAAAGIFLTPDHQLAIYSAEHYYNPGNDVIDFKEFWPTL